MRAMTRRIYRAGASPGRLAALVMALSLTLAACGGSSSTPEPATTSTSTTTSTTASETVTAPAQATATAPEATVTTEPTTAAATATSQAVPDELMAMAGAFSKVERFRMTGVMTNAAQPEQKIELSYEAVRPDKLHLKFSGGATVAAGGSLEMIVIGDTTYMKLGDTWTTSPMPQGSLKNMMPFDPEQSVQQSTDALDAPGAKITPAGTETIDGVVCQVWEITSSGSGGAGSYQGKYWVGKDDQLPRKMTITTGDGTLEMTFSDFNGDFDIVAPM